MSVIKLYERRHCGKYVILSVTCTESCTWWSISSEMYT